MRKSFSWILVLFLAISVVGCEKFFSKGKSGDKEMASPVNIVGSYQAQGTNPGGAGTYHGTVTIAQEGDKYKVHWEVGNVYDGVGKVDGNIFRVEWGFGGKVVGILSYTIESNRVLRGTWHTYDHPEVLGTETLTPQ